MGSIEDDQPRPESTEEFSERVVFEWYVPGLLGGIAMGASALLGVSEVLDAGIGVGLSILLHKAMQKIDLFEHWREH